MRSWITDLNPGQSAFENLDPLRRPHRMIDGEYVPNTNKNADKYRRALPDEVAPCVHTRNDILSSQNTIHPFDDRVFSIAELMCMLTVPTDFRWTTLDDAGLRSLSKNSGRLWNEPYARSWVSVFQPPLFAALPSKQSGL